MSADVRLALSLAAVVNAAGAPGRFVLAYRLRRAAAAARAWPSAPGRVASSRLVAGRRTPAADVAYEYAVDGRTHYTGNLVDVAHRAGGVPIGTRHRAVRALLGRHPRGAAVPVFHGPERPERAVLGAGAGMGLARVQVVMGCGGLVAAATCAATARGSG